MSLHRPPLSRLIAKDLLDDVVKLGSDFWILEGAFGKIALFISDSVKIHCEDFPAMDRAAMDLVKFVTEKEGTDPPIDFDDRELKLFKDINSALSTKKNDLTELRIKLEGPTWHNYDPEVEYKIIGNQRNPGQKGSPAPKPPKPRKSSRITKASKSASASMASPSGSSSKKDDAADGLVALARSNTRGKNVKAEKNGAFIPLFPSPLAGPALKGGSVYPKDQQIAQLKLKHSQARKDFVKTLNHWESEINELEDKVSELTNSHQIEILQKDRMIQDRDDAISHQKMLIKKYKTALGPTGIEINHENGELILGSIGKRGFEEDYEQERVQDLKRRKVALQDDIDELMEKKQLLEDKVLSQGERFALKGKAKALDHGDELGEQL